jgi:hypothetical protein
MSCPTTDMINSTIIKRNLLSIPHLRKKPRKPKALLKTPRSSTNATHVVRNTTLILVKTRIKWQKSIGGSIINRISTRMITDTIPNQILIQTRTTTVPSDLTPALLAEIAGVALIQIQTETEADPVPEQDGVATNKVEDDVVVSKVL